MMHRIKDIFANETIFVVDMEYRILNDEHGSAVSLRFGSKKAYDKFDQRYGSLQIYQWLDLVCMNVLSCHHMKGSDRTAGRLATMSGTRGIGVNKSEFCVYIADKGCFIQTLL